MTEPLRPAAPSPAPASIELEPVLISARPAASSSVPIPVAEVALECLAKLDGAVLALAARPVHPAIGGLVALKAGLELGQCVAESIGKIREEASVRQALERCAEQGGTPLGLVDGTLTCGVPAEVAE
jgi:hypothetical protein